jgi:hypothetical protein
MTEYLREPPATPTVVTPVDPTAALARKNLILGWALFALALAVFAGTIGVALIYLALD